MANKTSIRCTFAGHRDLQDGDTAPIVVALERVTGNDTELICYVGGMGEFDHMAEQAAKEWKRRHPEGKLHLCLVLPYMKKEVLNKESMAKYDEIIIPEEAETAHYKRAITLRNRWMVEQSDVVIAKIWRECGGAYETIQYAKKINKEILFL